MKIDPFNPFQSFSFHSQGMSLRPSTWALKRASRGAGKVADSHPFTRGARRKSVRFVQKSQKRMIKPLKKRLFKKI